METVTNHFNSEVCELADRAVMCVSIIQTARLDLERAQDINDEKPPAPKWWWRFSPYLRATARNYLFAQEVLRTAPLMIELFSAELRVIRTMLRREHQIDFCYRESGYADFVRCWIESRGVEYETSKPAKLNPSFSA